MLLSPATYGASPISLLKPVGSATLSVVFWDIYHSTLYSSDGNYTDAQRPVALQIEYLRDIDAEDLLEATAEEWDKLAIAKDVYQPWLKNLRVIWPDIKEHDTLLFVLKSDQSTEFYFNHTRLGSFDDKDFGSNFLRIWLDPKASYPKLRKQLIGKSK
ncbi:chalcone isomerase family protein [Paraglaciecola polaris]|uniref:Chalcone isomerase domain-containing protein n=1 Tax=Paraglaciecola polaris LMG 21857 TaxID=1129793 RepID=K7AJM2_9ALTE|nr:hypothetical protein GPLA_4596 [Paraglaciecola polaris LMG 21857]